MIMKLTLEKRIIITVTFLVICAAILVIGLIIPAIRYIKTSDRDTYNLRMYLERRHEQSTNFRTALQRYEKIRNQTGDLDEHVFRAGHELELITTLENVAAENKVKYKIITTNLDKLNSQQITLSLEATGNYTDILHYLADLENLRFFLAVNEVKLSQSFESDSRTQTTALNLDLSLYVIP
jgi:Tfp pilus assembly protein PilO